MFYWFGLKKFQTKSINFLSRHDQNYCKIYDLKNQSILDT